MGTTAEPAVPSVLLLDIETQPDLVWVWGVYDQNAIAVKEHWQVLSFSAEWVSGKKGQVTRGLIDYPGYKPGGSDKKILEQIHSLLDQADAVVAHNGIDFDMKKLNARFIYHGMEPPKPYKIIDTRREVSRIAGFSSNKLDWLARQLEIGKKLEHEGWPLWEGCINGELRWWNKMKRYNRHDVRLLKELYFRLSPWIRQSNAAVWSEGCPNPVCRSKHLIRRGFMRSRTRVYQRYQCAQCGTWSRATYSERGQHAKVVGLDPNSRP